MHVPQPFIVVRDNPWRGAGFSPLHLRSDENLGMLARFRFNVEAA